MIGSIATIAGQAARLSLRSGGGAFVGLVFFLAVVTVVPFGVGPDLNFLARIGPAVLWIGALLATLLGLDRMFQDDRDDGSLDLIALAGLVNAPLQAGDAAAGATAYNAKGCVGCHGLAGKKPIADYPVIGGKAADFLTTELNKFRTGERNNPVMMPMAAPLTDADIALLARYFSRLEGLETTVAE